MRLMLNRNTTSRLRLNTLNINNRPRPRKRNRMFTLTNRPLKLSRKSRNNLPIHRSKPDTLPVTVSLSIERSLTGRKSRHQPKRNRQLENIIRKLIIKQRNLNLTILRDVTIGIHKPLQKRPTLLARSTKQPLGNMLIAQHSRLTKPRPGNTLPETNPVSIAVSVVKLRMFNTKAIHFRNKMLHIVPVANNSRPVTIAVAQPVANNIRMNRHINTGTINKRRRQSLKAGNVTTLGLATSAGLPLKLQPLRKHLINRLNLPNPLTATKKDLNRPTMRPRAVNMGTVTKLNAISWLQNLRTKIRNYSHRTILRENLRTNL